MSEPSADNSNAERPVKLRDAMRRARIEAADRTGVVVDLRDAEVARLEILNEALDSLFKEIPDRIDLFDRGISQGDTPRLWIDVVAHVMMGRDKRRYRFVRDTRFGRTVLAESHETKPIVEAITDYIARRIIESEHALTDSSMPAAADAAAEIAPPKRSRGIWTFVLGAVFGVVVLLGIAAIAVLRGG